MPLSGKLSVSVVTPTYNRASLLARIRASLRTQTVDFEWIVVDDGSTDGTPEIVAQWADTRIAYVRMPCNRGVNAARNAGVKLARGTFIQFLDSDDEFVPGGLDRAVEAIRQAPANVGAVLLEARPAGLIKGLPPLRDGEVLREYDLVCRQALQGDKAVIYRREVFEKCLLPEDLRGCEQVFVYEVSKYYDYLWRSVKCTAMYRQDDNLSEPDNVIRRSHDIAESYELIVANHAALLRQYPASAANLLIKAMYRYLVAGDRRNAWKVYSTLVGSYGSPGGVAHATAVLCVGMAAPFGVERWRLRRRGPRMPAGQVKRQC